jgi:hypothetical protein
MPRNKRLQRPTRKGIVAAFVAVSMIFVLGMAAITLDGGGLVDKRRQAQAAADAAAMAGACVSYQNYPNMHGNNQGHVIADAAYAMAAANGFANDGVRSDVTVNVPPKSGIYAGQSSYIEVLVTWYQPRYFSRIWGTDTIPVKARAVSRGAWVPAGFGALVLDYSGKAALNAQGNGAFTDTEGPIIVNSDNSSAVVDGGNGMLKATTFFITGGATTSGGGQLITQPTAGQIFVGVHPTPDPLAYLTPPTVPPDGTIISTPNVGSGRTYILTPGNYNTNVTNTLPNFSSGDVVVLRQASYSSGWPVDQQGVYYLNGGGFHSTGANILMDPTTNGGVMFYNEPSGTSTSNMVKITGNSSGQVTISPLTNGPYSGITFWQDRASAVAMEFDGNGMFTVTGTIYAAGASLTVSGNGGQYAAADGTIQSGSQIGSQYICWDLSLSGNGNVHLGYPGNVAHQRILTLVE